MEVVGYATSVVIWPAFAVPVRLSSTEFYSTLHPGHSLRMRHDQRVSTTSGRRRRSAAWPPRQVGGCGFEPSVLPRSTPVACGPRSHRPVETRTTAYGARARTARCGLGCVAGAYSRRAPAQFVGRGSAAPPPHQVGGCGFGLSVLPRSTPVAHGPHAHRPVENRMTAHGARACTAQCGLGCVAGANSRRAPAQFLGRSSAARPPHQVGCSGFVPSALPRPTPMARAPCSNRSVENRTTAHGARTPALRGADLVVWLGPTRDALLPSSLAEAPPHGHRTWSAAAALDRRCYRARLP